MSRSEHNPKRALTRRAAGAVLAAACLLAGCSSAPGDASTAPEALESSPVETAAATTGQATTAPATTAPATTAPATTAPATEEADTGQAETDASDSGEDGIEELAVSWYALADPAVCERMTGRMLELGWGARGQRGRRLCRTNVDDAEPVEDVVVGEPELAGAEASVRVEYTVAGDRAADRIDFVRRDGVWLVDSVRLDG